MRRLPRLLFLLIAPALLGQSREPFPSDYTPSPCGDASAVCRTFNQSQFHDIAAIRGFDIGQEWIDAHWAELTEALRPTCAKVATCFSTPGTTFTFCNDVMEKEFFAVCDRYPSGSKDHERCRMFITTYWAGHDRTSRTQWNERQACMATQPKSTAERTFEWWMTPATIEPDYAGKFTIYAIDSETRVPVMAKVQVESKTPIYAEGPPKGQPTTFYAVPWRAQFVRVPSAQGHSALRPPQVTIEAPGYRSVTFSIPIAVNEMVVEMQPGKLKPGVNRATISARDAKTGEPVEARVMMGPSTILGKTNEPIEVPVGRKHEDIWVTSLYDRYPDVVVVPAKK